MAARRAREASSTKPLKPAVFHILLALAARDNYGYAVMQALIERGVIGDFRAGEPSAAQDGDADPSLAADLLRFGFTPLYTRYVDAWDAAEQLHDVLKGGAWRDDRFARRGKVT